MAPPAFSTLSALTELLVTAAVVWFFYKAFTARDYRWGLITVAIAYETLFNITYMVYRFVDHEEGVTHQHEAWVSWFLGVHGALSLVMFIGLIAFVVSLWRRQCRGDLDPLARQRTLAYSFLVFWGLSILSGEAIYLFYWTGVIH